MKQKKNACCKKNCTYETVHVVEKLCLLTNEFFFLEELSPYYLNISSDNQMHTTHAERAKRIFFHIHPAKSYIFFSFSSILHKRIFCYCCCRRRFAVVCFLIFISDIIVKSEVGRHRNSKKNQTINNSIITMRQYSLARC